MYLYLAKKGTGIGLWLGNELSNLIYKDKYEKKKTLTNVKMLTNVSNVVKRTVGNEMLVILKSIAGYQKAPKSLLAGKDSTF